MKIRTFLLLYFLCLGVPELYSWLNESFTLFTLNTIVMMMITLGLLLYFPREVLHRNMKDDFCASCIVLIPLIYYVAAGLLIMFFM
jgi:hypothetical protein